MFHCFSTLSVTRRFLACVGIAALVLTGFSFPTKAETSPESKKITYVVERRSANGNSYLHIRCSFLGNTNGITELGIPTDWASATGAENGIKNLVVETPDAVIAPPSSRDRRQINHPKDAQLTVTYDLVPLRKDTPSAAQATNYLPIIQPTHFHLIGWTSWVVPFISDRSGMTASIRFEGLPRDWSVASSYGEGQTSHTFDWNLMNFGRSIVIAGDYRIHMRQIEGASAYVRFAVRGEWSFADSLLASRAFTIIDGLRDFWSEKAANDFLVVLSPLRSDGISSFNGTALHHAFVTFATNDVTLTKLDFLWSHEAMHAWLPQKMGRLDEPVSKLAWFTEGFTDYYAHFLRAKWQLLSAEEFAAELNSVFRSLATSAVRTVDNETVAKQFHRDRQIQRLPYWRGMLLAARWDNAVRRSSEGKNTLRDVLKKIMSETAARRNLPLTRYVIEDTMKNFGVTTAAQDIDSYIEAGRPATLEPSAFDGCFKLESASYPELQMGFDYDKAAKQQLIVGVEAQSVAYAAGLRNGQAVVALEGRAISTEKEFSVTIRDGIAEKVITYLPASSEKRPGQRLQIGNSEACKLFFAR